MRKLSITSPGEVAPSDAHAVILLDQAWLPRSCFTPYFEEVLHSPGVRARSIDGRLGFELGEAGEAVLERLAGRPTRAVFFASSDTHVKTLAPVARRLEEVHFLVRTIDDFGAIRALEEEGLPFEVQRPGRWRFPEVDVAVTGNDWSIEEKLFIARARARKIPTACLQESLINLGDERRRMRWADYALLQGAHTLRYLRRSVSLLVGNPRYDSIVARPLPEKPKLFVNCNFTFGVHEEEGRAWIDDVVAVAEEIGVDYLVSRHPRCFLDLSGVENLETSGPYLVHEQLGRCSIIVTRFSSLAHEALLMGRHVVYYNPHGETMRYLNEDQSGLFAKVGDRAQLRAAIRSALEAAPPRTRPESGAAMRELFCDPSVSSTERCARAIRVLASFAKLYPVHDFEPAPLIARESDLYYRTRLRPKIARVPGLLPVLRGAKRAVLGPRS